MATRVAAVVAMMEWRGWISRRIFWLRAALITWAAIGTVFSAHVGAQMVFLYGAGVAKSSAPATSRVLGGR
jgi:hypothetical protein